MAEELEELQLETEDEEEGGGPVKSFLEHLEDLRWVLIKSGAAVMIAMVVCLLAASKLVGVLMLPLKEAHKFRPHPKHELVLWAGTNLFGAYSLKSLEGTSLAELVDTNRSATHLELAPVQIGTNWTLGFQKIPTPLGPYEPSGGPGLIFLTPAGAFLSSLKIAFFGGILIALPFVLYFVGEFVVPALKKKEKKYLSRALGIGIGLFMLGALFCYFVMLPVALRAAEAYALWLGVSVQNWMAESYFTLVVMFMLAMGLGFEMPVVLLALVKLGILDYSQLMAARKYMVVICLVVGAMLTPPDVVTQILMALPLMILFEVTIWIARYWRWREKKQTEAQEAS